jgi:hypothetical protein
MIDFNTRRDTAAGNRNAAGTDEASPEHAESTMSKSMHDGVEVWCDCCSCEAEPYWVEAMKDYEQKNQQ